MRGHDFGGQCAQLALFARGGGGVDDGRKQHDAVDRDVAIRKIACEPRRARRAVTLPADKNPRTPEIVLIQKAADKLWGSPIFVGGGRVGTPRAARRAGSPYTSS